MKGVKKWSTYWHLSVLLFAVVLSSIVSIVSTTQVSASSAYDNLYQTTDKLILKNDQNANTIDLSVGQNPDYIQYILQESNWWFNQRDITYTVYRDSFVQAYANGSVFVSHGVYNEAIYVAWTVTPDMYINWTAGGGSYITGKAPVGVQLWSVAIYYYNGVPYTWAQSNDAGGSATLSYPDVMKNYYTKNVNLNLPSGYAGEAVRTSPPSPIEDISDQMTFSYEYDPLTKKVMIWNSTPNPPLDDTQLWCGWNITNNYVSSEDLITYYTTTGYREPEGSAWGTNSCRDVITIETDGNSVLDVTLTAKDDDGNLYGEISQNVDALADYKISGTAGSTWNTVESDYEDCSTHGWDVAPRLTCEITNLGRRIRDFFLAIFTPSPETIVRLMDEDNGTFGLTTVITAPLNVIQTLSDAYGTCQPLDLPLPFVNRTIQLPCMNNFYQQYGGAFYTIYQVIVSGVMAYWVAVRVLAMVKGFKDPKDDKVELFDL